MDMECVNQLQKSRKMKGLVKNVFLGSKVWTFFLRDMVNEMTIKARKKKKKSVQSVAK